MRFGGHETFYIRDGWLYKGLNLLLNDPDGLVADSSHDLLGVGKNMAKSIRYWLEATGLATRQSHPASARKSFLKPTDLARVIWTHDKYFMSSTTLWILHTNILHNKESAYTWHWFFNDFRVDKFHRDACLRRLISFANDRLPGRTPSSTTLERDLSCLILTYATEVPPKRHDPEEDAICPFRELDLVLHFKDSGQVQVQHKRRRVDHGAFAYALNLCLNLRDEDQDQDGATDIRLFDLARLENNPSRVFGLSTDGLYEALEDIMHTSPQYGVAIQGFAGDRQIRVKKQRALVLAEAALTSGGRDQ